MSNYGQFFIRRDILEKSLKIENEENIGKQHQNIDFEDASNIKNQIKIPKLDLQITTHKIILTHSQNQQICFYTDMEKIQELKTKKGGMFGFGGIDHLNVYLKNKEGKIRLVNKQSSKELLLIQQQIEEALSKKIWLIKPPPKQTNNGLYSGYQNVVENKKYEIQEQENKFQSSFEKKGDINSLMQKAGELKQIIDFIKNNSQSYKENNSSEMDNILQGIGCFDIITKDESGRNYINQLSNQIYQEICVNLFDIYGGVIPLLDLYYFYNKKRGGINYINADDVYQACQNFQKIGIKAKISVYENNIKVIESTEFDMEKDFEKDLGKYIDHNGITPEQLTKKMIQEKAQQNKSCSISVLIARIKLNRALKAGKVVVDDRIEGSRYFKNYFMIGF